MALSTRVIIQDQPFDLSEEYQLLKSASLEVGALAIFVGTVRDLNDGDDVGGLKLEHYPGMTEKEISKILSEAGGRWDIMAASVIHRVGDLLPGDEIVYAGVSSRHRGDAFAACQFIMDFLKTRAPFWKKETTPEGDRWLTTRQSDLDAEALWETSDLAD